MTIPEPANGTASDNSSRGGRVDDWGCYAVQQAGRAEISHHIVGSICHVRDAHEVREGCVTSAIVSIDPAKRTLSTESGVTHELGPCGDMTPDAFYVWRRWQRTVQATHVVDVTAEINGALEPAIDQPVPLPPQAPAKRRTKAP